MVGFLVWVWVIGGWLLVSFFFSDDDDDDDTADGVFYRWYLYIYPRNKLSELLYVKTLYLFGLANHKVLPSQCNKL